MARADRTRARPARNHLPGRHSGAWPRTAGQWRAEGNFAPPASRTNQRVRRSVDIPALRILRRAVPAQLLLRLRRSGDRRLDLGPRFARAAARPALYGG